MPQIASRWSRLALTCSLLSVLALAGCSNEPADPRDDREICEQFLDVSARWITSVTTGDNGEQADSDLTEALAVGEKESRNSELKGAFISLGDTIQVGTPNDVLRVMASTMATCVSTTGAELPDELNIPSASIFPTSTVHPPLLPSGMPPATP